MLSLAILSSLQLTEVTKKDIISLKQSNRTFMVLFYAPWCGHCQNFKPHYEAAAKHLNGIVPLVAMDCTTEKNQATCARYQVQGYPTVLLFNSKSSRHPLNYQSGRTKTDVINYVKMEMRDPFVATTTVEEFKNQLIQNQENSSKIIAILVNNKTVPKQAYRICNIDPQVRCLIKTGFEASDFKLISELLHIKENKLSQDRNNLVICKNKKNCSIVSDTSLENVKKLILGMKDEM